MIGLFAVAGLSGLLGWLARGRWDKKEAQRKALDGFNELCRELQHARLGAA